MLSIARYLSHGILEFAAFMLVALAGGIVSMAITHHDLGNKKWKIIMKDALQLIIIAIIILVIAAFVEVYFSMRI